MTNIDKKGYHPVIIRIYTKDKQQVLEDEVLCAYDTRNSAIVSMGKAGLSYIQDDHVAVVNPMKWGVVADYVIFNKVVSHYIKKQPTSFKRKPRIAVCVPAKLTEVERTAFTEAFMQSTRKPFYLLEKSFAQMSEEGMDVSIKDVDYYVEFVSEYYESEYFG